MRPTEKRGLIAVNQEPAVATGLAPVAPSTAAAPVRLRFILHAGFVLTGVVTVLLGPVLPYCASLWKLSDAQSGTLFTAQFLGSMAGVALASPLLQVLGFRRSLGCGYAAMATGIVLLGSAIAAGFAWTWAAVTVVIFGIGLGIVIPATNLSIAALAGEGRSASLNRLNAAWAVGAIACAPFWSLCLRERGPAGGLAMLGVVIGCVAAWLLSCPSGGETVAKAQADEAPPARVSLLFTFTISVLLFLYVGTETSVGGWAAAFATRLSANDAAIAAPSFFWAMLAAGRFAAPWSLRRMSEARLMNATLLLTVAGTLLLSVAGNFLTALAAIVLSGIGLAPVYPLLVGAFSRLGAQANKSAGVVFAAAGLGGATLPWVVGLVSSISGNLRYGLLVPVAGCAVILVVSNLAGTVSARAGAPRVAAG